MNKHTTQQEQRINYKEFLNRRAALRIRVEALREQEARYDTPKTATKHSEVVADLAIAQKAAEEFDAAYPEHIERMRAGRHNTIEFDPTGKYPDDKNDQMPSL